MYCSIIYAFFHINCMCIKTIAKDDIQNQLMYNTIIIYVLIYIYIMLHDTKVMAFVS